MGVEFNKGCAALCRLLSSLSSQKVRSSGTLLDIMAQFCVDEMGAAFARIWLVDETGTALVLKSSRGQYTRLDGTRSRIPIGQNSKIDKIYSQGSAHLTNNVLNDPGVIDKEWARREGFVSFMGHPLQWNGEKLGVFGMYSRELLADDILLILEMFVFLVSAVIFQQNQTERNMNHFCEVTGFKPALLDQLIRVGRTKHSEARA